MSFRHLWDHHPHVRSGDALTAGERWADRVRNGMGSWAFIGWQTLFVIAWVIGNVESLRGVSLPRWDPYPFILLNLMFSVQAAYASPIILLSQRRGDAKASELALATYRNGEQILALTQENKQLTVQVHTLTTQQMEILAQQSAILEELRALRAERAEGTVEPGDGGRG